MNMNLQSPQKDIYANDHLTAIQAQRLAQEIAFGPIVFQVSRLMVKWNIFKLLDDHKNGMTMEEIVQETHLSKYGVQVLLESYPTSSVGRNLSILKNYFQYRDQVFTYSIICKMSTKYVEASKNKSH